MTAAATAMRDPLPAGRVALLLVSRPCRRGWSRAARGTVLAPRRVRRKPGSAGLWTSTAPGHADEPQLAGDLPSKQAAAGSNPVVRSTGC